MRRDDEPAFQPRLLRPVGAQQFRDRLDRRLDRQHIKAGGGDVLVAQRVVERIDIDDRAARVVDDDRTLRQQRELLAAEQTEFPDSYQVPLLCLVELVTLLASALRLFGRGIPATTVVSWLGFAFSVCFSLLFLIIAFFFQFRCCGYL